MSNLPSLPQPSRRFGQPNLPSSPSVLPSLDSLSSLSSPSSGYHSFTSEYPPYDQFNAEFDTPLHPFSANSMPNFSDTLDLELAAATLAAQRRQRVRQSPSLLSFPQFFPPKLEQNRYDPYHSLLPLQSRPYFGHYPNDYPNPMAYSYPTSDYTSYRNNYPSDGTMGSPLSLPFTSLPNFQERYPNYGGVDRSARLRGQDLSAQGTYDDNINPHIGRY